MKAALKDLLQGLAECHEELPVTGLTDDSRAVAPGSLFAALVGGQHDGMRFAREAQIKGAAAIVYDPQQGSRPEGLSIPAVPVPGLREKLGIIADRFYGQPSQHLEIVGITGTNGKTSCSFFLAQTIGSSAVMGTLGWGRLGDLKPSHHTTAPALEVQRRLAHLLKQGVRTVTMEVSSHALAQGRVNGVRFDIALWTNLSRDHLDYHGSLEAYAAAKQKLLMVPGLKGAVLNLDDPAVAGVCSSLPSSVSALGFSCTGNRSEIPTVQASAIDYLPEGLAFTAHFGNERAKVEVPLLGDFNLANVLAVMAVLKLRGLSLEAAADRISLLQPVPGRMESFGGKGRPRIVIDYAHTPAALETALKSLRRHCHCRLWVVFGCGGDRDRGKRPQMGSVAERWADRVILTDDNPRSEDGERIINAIVKGMNGPATVIRNRSEAICHAFDQAQEDDVILVAGKGHETIQEIDGCRLPYSDLEVVRQLLGERAACV